MAKRSTFIALLGVVVLVMATSAVIGQPQTGTVPAPTGAGTEAAPADKQNAPDNEAAPDNKGGSKGIDEAPPAWEEPIKNHEKRLSALEARKSQKSKISTPKARVSVVRCRKDQPLVSPNNGSRLDKLEHRMDKAEKRLDTHGQLIWKHETQINGKGGLADKMGNVWADRMAAREADSKREEAEEAPAPKAKLREPIPAQAKESTPARAPSLSPKAAPSETPVPQLQPTPPASPDRSTDRFERLKNLFPWKKVVIVILVILILAILLRRR